MFVNTTRFIHIIARKARFLRAVSRNHRQQMRKRKHSVATRHLRSSNQGLVIVLCGLCAIATLDHMLICSCNREAMRRKRFGVDLVEAPTSLDREAYLRYPSKVLILVPFTARDIVTSSGNLDRWREIVPAYDSTDRKSVV